MIPLIDAITHQLNGAHIARRIHESFEEGHDRVQLVCETYRVDNIVNIIRVNLSQMFNQIRVPKQDRYGLRCSDPYPFTFEDGRPGRFYCINITVYHSKSKAMLRAVSDAMEQGISL